MTREKSMEASYRGCFWSFIAVGILAILLFTSSCTTTRYVPVIEYHTDTLIQTKVLKDSVFLHDSISIKEKGDTVLIEKWHTKYVKKQVHDTTYISKMDTVPQPYPVPEYVEKELSWWQRFRMNAGGIALGLLAVCVGYGIFRFIKRL